MSPALALGVTTAAALVLLIGLSSKATTSIRREMEIYASGYNRDLAQSRLTDRYDSRFSAFLLVVAFGLQAGSLAFPPALGLPAGWRLLLEAGVGVAASLMAWWTPRALHVKHELELLEQQITAEWKENDEAAARERGGAS